MQYEVYLDVLFLENMMMDFLILLADIYRAQTDTGGPGRAVRMV